MKNKTTKIVIRTPDDRIETANQAYQIQFGRAFDRLKVTENLLSQHEQRQNGNVGNWGYVGDMELVNRELNDIIAFLGGIKS